MTSMEASTSRLSIGKRLNRFGRLWSIGCYALLNNGEAPDRPKPVGVDYSMSASQDTEAAAHEIDKQLARGVAHSVFENLGIKPSGTPISYDAAIQATTLAVLEAQGLVKPQDYAESLKED